MAAPVATARQTPVGIWIPDGFRTKFTFALDPDASLWEVTVKPMGFDAGEPIPQDSMWNVRWMIKRAQQLIDTTPSTITFLYDPQFRSTIEGMLGIETTVTETLYDGSTCAYYGYLRSAEFDPLERGQPGRGTATVQPTNYDRTNRVEAGPVFVNVAGS